MGGGKGSGSRGGSAAAPRAAPRPAFVLEEVVGAPSLHAVHGASPRVSEKAKEALAAAAARGRSAPKKWGAGAAPKGSAPKMRAPPGGSILQCADESVPLTKVQAQVPKLMGLKDASKTTGAKVKSALSSPRAMQLGLQIVKAEMA